MFADYALDLDRFGGSTALLLSLFGVALAGWAVYAIGLVDRVVNAAGVAVRAVVAAGFRTWRRLLAWAEWPALLALVAVTLAAGVAGGRSFPALPLACGSLLLFVGVAACLAYMFVDVERYDVARGARAIHNPLPGQAPAPNLVRYGDRLELPLLAVAAVAVVGGFTLLNLGLYATVGRGWYTMAGGAEPGFTDFLAYTLLNLLRVVDLLHVASSYNYVRATDVRQAAWPSSTLLTLFKSFFTLVLLQQLSASVRRGRVLSEVIADFWSPHPHLQERARGALPQHGTAAVRPLLASLRATPALTAEQCEYLPRVFAGVGPAAVPVLLRHLNDPHAGVRAVAVAALGQLHARGAVPEMARLAGDADAGVRQALAEALGTVAGAHGKMVRKPADLIGDDPAEGLRWRMFRRTAPPRPTDAVPLAVTVLSGLLADPSPGVRERAAGSLGTIGPAAAPAAEGLIGALGDPDERVRVRAAEAVGRVGGATAVPALAGLLADASPLIRVAAARALGGLGADAASAIPGLTPLLNDADESVRAAAADALGRAGPLSEGVVRDLAQGLKSHDTIVRSRTAEALGQIGEAAGGAAPALAAALSDGNDRVRAEAVQALGQIGEAAAVAAPALVRALQDEDAWVSALAAEALGEVGTAAAGTVPALVRSLRHANAQVRANAAEALGKLGAPARMAESALTAAASDPEAGVRAQAVAALGAVGAADTGRVALRATGDESPQVRAAAVEVIGRYASAVEAGSVEALLAAASDANEEVRVRVAEALSRFGGAALDALGGLLRDVRPAVQLEAARALGRLGADAVPAGPALAALARTGEDAVREQALRALAVIQPPEAAEAFALGLRDARPDVRVIATAGLVKMATVPPDAVPGLVEALRDPEARIRANAARVLARLEPLPAEAADPLAACAGDPDDGVRLGAALALRNAPRAAAPALRLLLADLNPRLRLLAAGSLLKTDPTDAGAVGALVAALSDPSPHLRRAALELAEVNGARLLDELRRRVEFEADPEVSGLLASVIDRLAESATGEADGVVPPAQPLGESARSGTVEAL